MNISSVVINLKEKADKNLVLNELSKFKDVEIIAHKNDKIVAVVTADDVNGEVATFRRMEMIEGVATVAMVYAYQEDVEFDKDKLDKKQGISEILTNDNVKAEDICYNGSVHYKVR
ncbi:chaperone NapD [Campylobacter sp. RM9344]|uniref:Chaperone NapD n=1 Tax=Campylobacter californiensis TaxID=1032243 RepID=A0AAW3ZV81_9BACT|nr:MULTISPECIES: chaperone NapD [unclassified Campylobacter]MBE2984879.1 chaperone NapD [Campylobacter sp. RM6883]MBE2986312.1 chaperone NapD [Campylobacter sp. RM12919]MBE2988057.1 chaperone NapD [Campylobacter sp. RM12920]MBE2995345.1 chaperone NapD [Campylobacter sp. RM6913]MBE3022430.1 chaperone NapD [Campylobacter sp. 7477a]MBE3029320.1 chaperone NapD [Campylobacter sp. RM9344]